MKIFDPKKKSLNLKYNLTDKNTISRIFELVQVQVDVYGFPFLAGSVQLLLQNYSQACSSHKLQSNKASQHEEMGNDLT